MNPTNTLSPTFTDPWHLPSVADAQLALVTKQLADETRCAPFQAFLRALRHIVQADPALETASFLDAGCGVGHYGVLLARHYPRLIYFGADASAAMIERAAEFHRAREIRSMLNQCEFKDTPFYTFPLVLVSQVMEMLDDPPAALEFVLEDMRAGAYLILHRMRWSKEPAHAVMEKTYLGLDAKNFIWNEQEVLRACMARGNVAYADVWEKSATLVVEKQ